MSESSEQICNLSEEELAGRKALLRDEVMGRVRRSEALANGRAWEFDATPEMRAKLEELAAFERNCCGSLAWELRETGGVLRLEVNGIDPEHALLQFRSTERGEEPG